MRSPSRQLVIAGGGLSGCLAALALANRRPEVDFLLIEQGRTFGGRHTWSFFDTDVAAEDRWLIEPLLAHSWSRHDVYFPERVRTIDLGYNSIGSGDLDRLVRATLKPYQYRLGARMAEVGETYVTLEHGERIEAGGVIDARGTGHLPGLDLAWQKFVGRTYEFEAPHKVERPIIMDATVEQNEGYRFLYTLPFSAKSLMVEDTYYSTSPTLDVPLLRCRIDSYMLRKGWGPAEVVSEEQGILPIALGGDMAQLWPTHGSAVPKLGLKGGFFHPTTGYSLPDAVRNAVLLADQTDLRTPALHALFRKRAFSLWRERSFYRMLNRLLFRAAAPRERFRVLQHFYRLPKERISRFYGGRSTRLDKLRILSGKPPVPLGKAISVLRARAA